jgi:hypothetical protein
MERTRAACPASKPFSLAADSSRRQLDGAGVQDAAVGAASDRDEALLGGQDADGGE